MAVAHHVVDGVAIDDDLGMPAANKSLAQVFDLVVDGHGTDFGAGNHAIANTNVLEIERIDEHFLLHPVILHVGVIGGGSFIAHVIRRIGICGGLALFLSRQKRLDQPVHGRQHPFGEAHRKGMNGSEAGKGSPQT